MRLLRGGVELNFFEFISDFVSDIFRFLVGFVRAGLQSLTYVNNSVSITTELASYAPDIIGGCIAAVVAISVIKNILGRHAG